MTSGYAVKSRSGDFLGSIQQDVYVRFVQRSRHMLHNPNDAWAFDADAVDKVIRPAGVKLIKVIDREEGKTYEVSMTKFLAECGEINYAGRQYFLILDHWIVR